MSFHVVCSGCGAISGPSVGICPYCKSVMLTNDESSSSKEVSAIAEAYGQGRGALSLALAKKYYLENPKAKQDINFLILYVKLLIESEGPSVLISGLLEESFLLDQQNQEVLDYLDLIDAKLALRKGSNDEGEVKLKHLIRRSPHNVHANFILGSHLYWVDKEAALAVGYLETCVKLSPNFLRAWGCLSAIYQELGDLHLALNALHHCVGLETEKTMKEFFQGEIERLSQ